MSNIRIWIEAVLYGSGAGRRFTQDSPVLPDVWVRYLEQPVKSLDLLIEPWLETPPSQVAGELLRRFRNESEGKDPDFVAPDEEPIVLTPPEIESVDEELEGPERGRTTYNRTMVVSQLTLRDLIRHVVPLTFWYQTATRRDTGPREVIFGFDNTPSGTSASFDARLPRPAQLWDDVARLDQPALSNDIPAYAYPKILSLVRISGLIAYTGLHGEDAVAKQLDALAEFENVETVKEAREILARCMVSGFRQVIK